MHFMEDWITMEILGDFGIQHVNKKVVFITNHFGKGFSLKNHGTATLNKTTSLFILLRQTN